MHLALPSIARALVAGAVAGTVLLATPAAPVQAAQADQVQDRAGHHHKKKKPTRVERAVDVAVNQKGDPYRYGAAGPGAFDCSGLVFYSFRRAGFSNIPRTSSAQSHFAHRISRGNMQRGDLMFFHDSGGVYHVGVFAGYAHGKRLVLHAPYSGTRVRTDRVWTDSWFPGTLRKR
ncbi:C40 family peptidase [Nocardioides sp. SR21]|uniref:C40 family peptidase n=1 Tax=Nocardioides sp. SR21 TaxID=2919501 RepID=UPI001FAA8608|nr:C40 family peptidase [Nocardioides sp. SR21]